MAKWSVAYRATHEFCITVDADDEDEAQDNADAQLDGNPLREYLRLEDLDFMPLSVDLIEPGEFCEHDDRDE